MAIARWSRRWLGLAVGACVLGPLVAGNRAEAHVGTTVYPVFELQTDDLPDLRDGSLQDWEDVLPGASLDHNAFAPLNVGDGAGINPADLAYRVFFAWHSDSQRLYAAVERFDDVYINTYEGGDIASLWRYDNVELMIDGDHSGGAYHGFSIDQYTAEEIRLLTNYQAQQYVAIAVAPDGINIGYQGNGQGWVTRPPWADASGFAVGSVPNTSVIEMYLTPWDECDWRGPEYSKRSSLIAGKIMGFQISIPDFDTEAGAYHGFYTISGQANTWRLADNFVDAQLIGCDTGDCGAPPLPPGHAVPVWSLGIGVTNSQGVLVDVELGLAGGGSEGLDAGLGERALPPVPPASAFDVRWRLPSGEGSEVDYRGTASLGPAVTWTLSIQSSSRGLPVTVSWDPTQLPVAGVYRLQDVETGGEVVNVDLRHQSSYQVTSVGLTELQVVYELVTQTYDLPAGWSLVSLPCALADARLSAIFPQAISLYRYRGRYELVTAFEPGVGYWVNLPSATQVTVRGPAYPDSAVAAALPEEWSLVGLGERTLDVAGLKAVYPSLVSVFGYLSGYFSAAAMTPGAAYWVNLSAPTQLDLSGAVAAAGAGKPVLAGLPAWTGPTLWAEGPGGSQAIALGAPAAAIVALPPLPPTGAFDVRVAVGSGVEACQVPAGGEPYRLRWQGGVDRLRWDLPGTSGWEVEVDGVVVPLAGQGELQVTASSAAWLRPGAVLPSATVLHPCYPNPFNPTTTIPYDLAQAGPVRLRVYAATGQLVRELVSALQPAGSYRATWDGRDQAGQAVGNGVYLCDLRSGDYRSVRRVALLK